jgi:uncharacterized protein (TIGR02996 family)
MARKGWWRWFARAEPVTEVDDPPPPPPRRRDPTLEAEIEHAPDAIEPYLVYADWLQQHGDPRGELISLHARLAPTRVVEAPDRAAQTATGDGAWYAFPGGELADAAAALIDRWPSQFRGPLDDRDRVDWHCGFWRRLRFACAAGDESAFAIRLLRVLAHDSARFLRELSIGTTYGLAVASILPETLPATLRALHLGDFVFPDESELSWTSVGDVTPLYDSAPDLERLVLQGAEIVLGDRVRLPRLRSLELVTCALSGDVVRAIARAKLPELETLIVWTGESSGDGCSAADLRELIGALGTANLRWFGLVNCEHTDEILGDLVAAPWFARLEELDLSKGTLTAAGVDTLARSADRLAGLARLDVSENLLDGAATVQAAALARIVDTTEQRFDDVDEGARYVAVTE